jgi:hypothetical protein
MTGDGVDDAVAPRSPRRPPTWCSPTTALGTVVAAVAEGRRVFDNIRRFVRYGLSGGLAEILVMLTVPSSPCHCRCSVRRSLGQSRHPRLT